jgi:outer membrane protein TolC
MDHCSPVGAHTGRPRFLGICFLSFVASLPAYAASLTLEDAQRAALERAPQLAGFEHAAAAARDMAIAAEQRPDPVLKLGVDNVPVDGADRYSINRDFMTMRRVGWMQEMPRAEKRSLRGERLRLDGRRALAERAAARARIERDAALAWIDAVYAERALQWQRAQVDALKSEIDAAEIAYRAGRGALADLHAARSAWLTQRDRVLDAERRLSAARTQLARWIGIDAARSPLAPPPDWSDAPTLADQARHPALAIYALQEAGAAAEEKLAAANAKPDWSWEVSYQQRGPGFSNMVSFGVSIPVPWDRPQRQDRETAARRAMVEQTRTQREDALRAQTAEAESARLAYESAAQRRRDIVPALLQSAAERAGAQLIAYRGGRGSLAEALAARRGELEAQLTALDIEADQARAWAALRYFAARADETEIGKDTR